ncbi:tryptophan--tRNA ligase [Marihabitans asiaticum]|uniref:Tryptophan--tRNA ligase n=2 Tax=Marihabitans asiaticum TaxID=415218 RepID=A0A560WCT2_9MICO|nr:tryptophanyl-tRNA synthetase [Marihabitans asiaticum]
MAPTAKPRILSGMQPTSDSLHLGNYLGALVNWRTLQADFDAYFFVADLHSLTVATDPEVIRRRTRLTAAQFIAAGIDPERSAVFCQSHIRETTEVAWVLGCQAAVGEMNRMTQFKDKTSKGQSANVGLFTYPVLMASDILLYNPQYVPVGDDQRQHLEITRDLALRFNARFGEVFEVPEGYIPKESARIMDLQDPTSKMSKSSSSPKGLLDIMDDPARLAKKVRSAVTDTEAEIRYDVERKPGVSNLLVMASVLGDTPIATLEQQYSGRGYGDLKKDVAELVVETVTPFRQRIDELLDDPAELDGILARGAERAGEVALATRDAVFDAVGLLPAGSR